MGLLVGDRLRRSIWVSLIFIFLLTGTNVVAHDISQAQNGVLDLRGIKDKSQPVELTGEWKWYWHQLRKPTDSGSGYEYITVPALWGKSTWHNKAISSQGYATYELTVLLPRHSQLMTQHQYVPQPSLYP